MSPSMNNHINNAINTPLPQMNGYEDLLFTTPNGMGLGGMDFLMMDLAQNGTNNIMSSPLLDCQHPLNGTMNITPSLNALTNGLFDLSTPNTPHLPPLSIDANSQNNNNQNSMPKEQENESEPVLHNINNAAMPSLPTMPNVDGVHNNIPPPTDGLDWQTFCTLIQQNGDPQTLHTQIPSKKRKKLELDTTPNTKKRKLNHKKETKESKKSSNTSSSNSGKKKKRGRPRKNPEKVTIKKEKKDKRRKKNKEQIVEREQDEEDYDMEEYLQSQYGQESYVGIRTEDGEVRIQIPRNNSNTNNKQESEEEDNGHSQTQPTKIKFTVFGNACSDKIEDILQPKKRTRYVRGLTEEEKKRRRREQNRNAAARSRARKNAMISKVIQLHQENMGLRAFVAENITQTKILRDEISRLNAIILLNKQQNINNNNANNNNQSSLFDIINQDSSTLFQQE